MAFLMRDYTRMPDVEYPPDWEGFRTAVDPKEYYRKGIGVAWSMGAPGTVQLTSGLPVKMDSGPSWIRRKRAGGQLPHFYAPHGPLISREVKEFINGLEPNTHQFIPVEVLSPKLEPIATHYFLNVCQRLDAIDPEASGAERIFYPDGQLMNYRVGHNPNVVLRADAVRGKHLWFDMYFDSSLPFVSQDFVEGLKRPKLGLRLEFDELKEI